MKSLGKSTERSTAFFQIHSYSYPENLTEAQNVVSIYFPLQYILSFLCVLENLISKPPVVQGLTTINIFQTLWDS